MEITIQSWGIPAIVTGLAFLIAASSVPESRGDYDFGPSILAVMYLAAAVIVSLIAWLIWALFA